MSENENRTETEEERRIRIRRMRRRREMIRRRRRRIRMIRLIIAAVIAAAVIIVIISAVRKAARDRAAEAASQAEPVTAEAMDQVDASEVLHLTFPVLSLDRDSGDGSAGDDAAGSGDEGDTAAGDQVSGVDNTEGTSSTSSSSSVEQKYGTPLTVSEFNSILQQLYDDGYVLVNIYGTASSDENNGMTAGKVSVPAGKKPLVISEQDASYRSGYDGRADQMIISDSGEPVCSYTGTDGTVSRGSVDIVPCVNDFVKAHPDFSVSGARGIIGITGYQGILGYSVTEDSQIIGSLSGDAVREAGLGGGGSEDSYSSSSAVSSSSASSSSSSSADGVSSGGQTAQDALAESTGTLRSLLSVLRSEGWQTACNSYAHISYASDSDIVRDDMEKWQDTCGSITGTTDIMLMADGGDIDGWTGYSDSNEKYQLLSGDGFRYYCVENDGELTWLQVGTGYARQGMHEIDSMKDFNEVMQMG